MHIRRISLMIRVLLSSCLLVLLVSCAPTPPAGTLSVASLLSNPVYEETKVYGQISALKELNCPCFFLTSEGKQLDVWYGLMVEDGKEQKPPVDVSAYNNGDWVVVTGELRKSTGTEPSNTFWLSKIDPLP